MTRRPRLLDLYCGAGGAAMGYHLAGFEVTGVDLVAQPRYPFTFVQADAIEYVKDRGHEYDAVHASPPCQDHSVAKGFGLADHGTGWLLPYTIECLGASGLPFVVENVQSAAVRALMPGAFMLCGSMFGLGAHDTRGQYRVLKRHRLFLANFPVPGIPACTCRGKPVGGIYGHGEQGVNGGRGYGFNADSAREAMGTPWVSRDGCAQAIPPAYTRHIGDQLMIVLSRRMGHNENKHWVPVE